VKVALYVPPMRDENTVPLLGPLYLLAVLEQDGIDGRLFDARIDPEAFQKLLAFGPDVMGVSAVTPAYLGGLRAAKEVKARQPSTFTVFGGPHPASLPREVVAEPSVDFVVMGEGETAFLDLCRRIKEKATSAACLREVRSLAFKDGEGIVITERSPFLSGEALDRLPWPAFHRMDLEAYFAGIQAHGIFRRGKRVLTLMTARGCPQGCTFCCRVMGRGLRSRSVESVMAEVRFLVDKYGIDELYLEDDNFTVQRERALDILERLAAFMPPLYLKFANGLRADQVDSELLQAMKKARVYSLSFGIESGCEATLKKMKKALDLGKARENVLLAKAMGFLVGANCIIGYPGETPADVEESLGFFLSLPLDSMAIVNLVPFPGTEVREFCERNGHLTDEAKNWDNYFFSLRNPIPLIETPVLPRQELTRLMHRAYRRMYLRPQWLWRTMRHLSVRQVILGVSVMLGLRGRRTT